MSMEIHNTIWESLGCYVYAYIDPNNSQIRYIGKGTGNRALSHINSRDDSEKVKWIQSLRKRGQEPQIDIIARNLTEVVALLVERSLIDAIGIGPGKLTNQIRGQDVEDGRETLHEIAIRHNPEPAEFKHNILMLRLNQHWRQNMSDGELYDITRGVWKLGKKRERVEVVLAIVNGLVVKVYIPESWHQAGTTEYLHIHPDIDGRDMQEWISEFADRCEFIGREATKEEHLEYLYKDVSWYYKKGERTSRRYTFD